ncbi:unnamed protein product [Mytilus coruscus]|uniref:Uncharacterized protein n=1 Tax=Mytilus coruscus TaxID=42192 RepID=A0A6J8APC9_MYTCO|nr:unnamed protein product [Mytilus coruscus]
MLYHADSLAYNRSQTLQMVTCSSLSDDDNNPEASTPIYELSDTEETIVKEIFIQHATHDQIKSPKPPPYPQFNAAQNLQHQNVNQSYNSQHIQRDLRVNVPQPKLSVSQTDRCHRPEQRKNHKKSQIPPRLHNNNMRQISEEVLTKHKHQQNENMTNVRQAQSTEGSPLFNSSGDIPCDNSADSSPHDGQHPMQTVSSSNYSPQSDMALDVTSRDCLPTTKVDDPEPEISHNSFLGLSQNNIPPDLGLNKIRQNHQF